ncbi:MAG: hypothetical protein HZB23_12760 [Deltaproteobacteria bacterium]|nr:hypothetical protein [Deltaproteobacteria bacterium]
MKGANDRKHVLAGLFIAAASGLALSCVLAAASGELALLLLLVLVLGFFLAGAVHFYYRWHLPLAESLGVIMDMADGKFDGTAPPTLLGDAVNQVSVNTQEAFLLVWNHTKDALGSVAGARESIAAHDEMAGAEILKNLDKLDEALAGIRDVISAFGFYGVHLVDEGGVADSCGCGTAHASRPD